MAESVERSLEANEDTLLEEDEYLGDVVREVIDTRPAVTATWRGSLSLRNRRSSSISLTSQSRSQSLTRGRLSLSRGVKVHPSLGRVAPIMEANSEMDQIDGDVSDRDVIKSMVDGGMIPPSSAPLSIRFDYTHTHTHT